MRRWRVGGVGWRLRGEGLDEANQLPALGFRELGPHRHTAPDYAVGQQPEQGAWGGLLDFVSAQAGTLFPAIRHFTMALGTMLSEEFAAGCDGVGILGQRIATSDIFLRSLR